MPDGNLDTVLLVCGCETNAPRILDRLYRAGYGVIGPVPTAGLALTLAAQTLPTIAVVASPPQGRRDASALGRELLETWGIRSWVFDGANSEPVEINQEPWMASRRRTKDLRRILLEMDAVAPVTP